MGFFKKKVEIPYSHLSDDPETDLRSEKSILELLKIKCEIIDQQGREESAAKEKIGNLIGKKFGHSVPLSTVIEHLIENFKLSKPILKKETAHAKISKEEDPLFVEFRETAMRVVLKTLKEKCE